MPKPKSPSRTEAIRQTLNNAEAPLTFDEFYARASAIFPMDAKGLKAALDNFRNNDYVTRRVLQQDSEGRYGWLTQFAVGAHVAHTLTAEELKTQSLQFEPELVTSLFPMHVYDAPTTSCGCLLPNGVHVAFKAEKIPQTSWMPAWGTPAEKNYWDWLKSERAQAGDVLLFHMDSAESSRCLLSFQTQTTRDKNIRVHERNDIFAEAIFTFLKPKQNGMRTEDIAARLLALGLYRDPCPPDALEQILKQDPRFRIDLHGWRIATRADHQYMALGLELDTFDFFAEQEKHPKRKRGFKKDFAQQAYRFLASFRHNKKIWRRIEICGDQTLWELDEIMRDAFGHDAMDHLSEFYLGTDAEAHHRGLGTHNPFEDGPADDWLIGELGLAPGDTLSYTYDFGDNIQHVLQVEAIGLRERDVKYPRVAEQNKPRYRYCPDCKAEGKQEIAAWICIQCSTEQERDVFACAEHVVSEHEDHYAEEIVY